MGSGSDLVYRVVLGWRFGPVPNTVVMFVTRLLISSESIAGYILEAAAFAIITAIIYLLRKRIEIKAKGMLPGFVFYAYYPFHLVIIWRAIQII